MTEGQDVSNPLDQPDPTPDVTGTTCRLADMRWLWTVDPHGEWGIEDTEEEATRALFRAMRRARGKQ